MEEEIKFENIYDLQDPFPVKPYEKLIINVALTGMVPTKIDNPYVPITPEEIIKDACKCYKAGASIVHIHAREDNGKPSYKSTIFEQIISGIKKKCPDLLICVTTSGRLFRNFDQRSEVLSIGEDMKPELASLTLGSLNFPKSASVNSPNIIKKLASKMDEVGMKPELEVFEVGMLNFAVYLIKKKYLKPPLYVNLLLGSLGTMPARTIDLCHLVHSLPKKSIWGGAGIGKFQLPINVTAIVMGGHVRLGLEDNLYYDSNREIYATNEKLVKRIARIAKEVGREIANPAEARRILNLEQSISKD
jgi:uncharacterized protein (DUF849 family)